MNTNSKASVFSRISTLEAELAVAMRAFGSTKVSGKNLEFFTTVVEVKDGLSKLRQELESSVKEDVSLPSQFDQKTFDVTMGIVRKKVLARFQSFPMAAAILELFMMSLETEMTFSTHFRSLHKSAMAEDRMTGNADLYGANGEPNAKGNGERS